MWTTELDPHQRQRILALADRARVHDGIDPLNEEARLSLDSTRAHHHLAVAESDIVGYLNHDPALATAQLVVDPRWRRRGIGQQLWAELAEPSLVGLWAFGLLPSARGFAAAQRLTETRRLALMTRSLTDFAGNPRTDFGVFTADDRHALLQLNATVFADHPEQGTLDEAGLEARIAEDWFDPAGLILARQDQRLVGFCWTKQIDDRRGEIYVIGIAPQAQGRGLGAALLRAGMSHLAAKGLLSVELYVDTAERKAVTMYERAGFIPARFDVQYRLTTQEQQ